MAKEKISLPHIGNTAIGIILLAALGCEPPPVTEPREISPATVTISLMDVAGGLERPEVEFDHFEHTKALDEDCAACHLKEGDEFVFKFSRKEEILDKNALMQFYHDKCIGCHKDRAVAGQETGPRACANCHVKRVEGISPRREMAFDYSLHFRHVETTGEEKCDKCHHLYDEKLEKLVYVKGKEDACRDCHGKVDEGKNLSLKNASHKSCVTCHLKAKALKKDHGPTLCIGCHDEAYQQEFEKIEGSSIPRLERGQKEKVLISLEGATAHAVSFDHKAHEGRASFCTTCHHKTPKPCKECHTLVGTEEGDFVTTEQAHHLASSERSCVGCHMAKANTIECAGCHSLPVEEVPPAKRTCVICHSGPHPNPPPVDAGTLGEGALPLTTEHDTPVPSPLRRGLGRDLPPSGDEFPEFVEIKTLTNEYGPSKMPHKRIAERLHEHIEKSELAKKFHGRVEVMCAGCHHRSPAQTKPRPCTACHSISGDEKTDKPGLKAAYHRQCMGCHEAMKIEKTMGCTDCHEKTGKKEVTQ